LATLAACEKDLKMPGKIRMSRMDLAKRRYFTLPERGVATLVPAGSKRVCFVNTLLFIQQPERIKGAARLFPARPFGTHPRLLFS
jgi:hypothetical protein